ncbi:putative Heme/steroid binding protein [Trichophyton interdigitale]|nr:putative Heme/steroid binding protein [Trichophyton interdigitale]KAG5217335.1 putative Heme/steroid binding protein [Trichophyton interdigitale]
MGWVGIGALIASISYILYKHPPTSWSFLLSPWSFLTGRRTPSDESNPGPNSIELPSTRQDATPANVAPSEDDDEQDGESTPKAKPTIPSSVIPPITLNEPQAISQAKKDAVEPSPGSGASPVASSKPNSTPSAMAPPPPIMTLQPPAPTVQAPEQRLPTPANTSLMPPPPPPAPRPSSSLRAPLRPPPSAAASLRVPPGSRPTTSTLPVLPLPGKPKRSSRPVILEPGHSPLDWAALTSNPRNNLRGADLPPTLIRVTPSMLKQHNGRKGTDAWTSYQGKVYNITPFAPFHPGGKGELLRGAGKDSEKLFAEIHPWVNWDGMLAECMVGILVAEHIPGDKQDGKLDEMD